VPASPSKAWSILKEVGDLYLDLCGPEVEFKRVFVHGLNADGFLVPQRHVKESEQLKEALEIFRQAIRLRSTIKDEFDAAKRSTARFFQKLAYEMSKRKHYEIAYAAEEQDLAITRTLILQDKSYELTLGSSLYNLAIYSERLKKTEEALALGAESVEYRRRWQTTTNERVDLALALYNNSIFCFGLNYLEQALQSVDESVVLYRPLAEGPSALESHIILLVNALLYHSVYLDRLGRCTEALISQEEAVALARRLVEINQRTYYPQLAACLFNLARSHNALKDWDTAKATLNDTIAVYQSMTDVDSALYQEGVAKCHLNFAIYHNNTKNWNEAVRAMSKALEMYRILHAQKPDEFLSPMADSLGGLGRYRAMVGEFEQGLMEVEEGMKLGRPNPAENPKVSESVWAYLLNAHAMCLHGLGRWDEAMISARASLDHFRPLFNKQPLSANNRRLLKEILETNMEVMELLGLVAELETLRDERRTLE